MVLQSHQGESVTCLRAKWAESVEGSPNHPCGWWVVTGDRRGIIVISSGEFYPVPKGSDAAPEDDSSKSTIERRGGITNGNSRHHQMSVKSVLIKTLSSDGEITCLAFTRSSSRGRGRSRCDEQSSSEEGKGRDGALSEGEEEEEMVAGGTSSGRIAVFDLHSGQVRGGSSLKDKAHIRYTVVVDLWSFLTFYFPLS